MIAHQLRQEAFIKKSKDYKNQNLVFARETDNPYYPDSLRKILHQILKKAGIANLRVHDLHHTCATLLMLSGVHSKVVQEILGHSTIGVTLDIYSHTLPSCEARQRIQSTTSLLLPNTRKPIQTLLMFGYGFPSHHLISKLHILFILFALLKQSIHFFFSMQFF